MNNSNALAEIQSKYPNCNLLLPAATSVQINPFYKCSVMEVVADTAPNSGDIFSVGKVKTGEDGKGKAIYEEVFSPAKPLLMKLATAAGIQFHPEYTTVIRENKIVDAPTTLHMKCSVRMLVPIIDRKLKERGL